MVAVGTITTVSLAALAALTALTALASDALAGYALTGLAVIGKTTIIHIFCVSFQFGNSSLNLTDMGYNDFFLFGHCCPGRFRNNPISTHLCLP